MDTEVTVEMREAGNQIAGDLMDASIAKSLHGTWPEYQAGYQGKNLDLLQQYVDENIDSVTAIYIAMSRAARHLETKHELVPNQ